MISYAVTLSDALTPITLISGVGLLLLAMTARYNYTTDRVRALLKERRQKAPAVDPVLEKAIRLTYERSHLIKNADSGCDHFSGLLRHSRFGDDSRASFGPQLGGLEIHHAAHRRCIHCGLHHFLCAGNPNLSEDHPYLHPHRERLIVVQLR